MAESGANSKFYIKVGSGSFVEVPDCRIIGSPAMTTADINVTDLASTHHEYIPGLPEPGVTSIEAKYSAATYGMLWDVFGELVEIKSETGLTGETWTGAAYLHSLSCNMDVDQLVMISGEFKNSGEVTYA